MGFITLKTPPFRIPILSKRLDYSPVIEHLRIALPGVISVYVFGSQTGPATHAESDVDLAVLCADALSPVARRDLQNALMDLLSRSVDLVNLRAASTVMQMQVVVHGTLLYEGDASARHAFDTRVFWPMPCSMRNGWGAWRTSAREDRSMPDDVILNKIAAIERCRLRIRAEYGGDDGHLFDD